MAKHLTLVSSANKKEVDGNKAEPEHVIYETVVYTAENYKFTTLYTRAAETEHGDLVLYRYPDNDFPNVYIGAGHVVMSHTTIKAVSTRGGLDEAYDKLSQAEETADQEHLQVGAGEAGGAVSGPDVPG